MPTEARRFRPCGRLAVAGVLVSALLQVPAGGREIHYGAVRDPELGRCDAQHWRGRLEESARCYGEILQSEARPAIRAEAAWALNDRQRANRLYREALAQSPDDASVRVRWGDLFADSHEYAEAMNLYREALAAAPDQPFARLGAARVLVGNFDDAANTYLNDLLQDASAPAGALAGGWLLVARVALESGDVAGARDAIDKAAALVDEEDWPPLHVYTLRAAADLIDNVAESPWTAKSLDYNPRYGGIYALPAYFHVIGRRYRDAIELYEKAVDIEPGLAAAHEALGVNLLRDNQVSRARRHLEIAHREDPFSPVAVNTLRLLDSFTEFRLVEDRPTEAGAVPVLLRLHADEAAIIAPYAIDLARASIAEFTERYGFALREPVIIEMYPDHEDFAVRTAGMPGLGILGATFGYVVAMDSPSGRPAHVFQWGTTLWHEMAHVFTLEATDHLVPRWFSEGVSVYEEWRSGPNPGVRIPMPVYAAIRDERLLPIAELDEGFIRPTYEQQVIVSYMQAGLICRFIEQRFGADGLRGLLHAFRDGLTTTAAVKRVLGLEPGEFDEAFGRFVETGHGTFLEHLDEWHETQADIAELAAAAQWDEVILRAERQLEILPGYVEPDSPYLALAKGYEERDQENRALDVLSRFWRNGGYDPDSLGKLSRWLSAAGRGDEAIDVLYSVNLVDPLDHEVHGTLGDLLLEAGRTEAALREFEIALALAPHDMATARYRLARAHYRLGNIRASEDNLLQALDVAPNFRPAQRLLLELAVRKNE